MTHKLLAPTSYRSKDWVIRYTSRKQKPIQYAEKMSIKLKAVKRSGTRLFWECL